MQQEPQFDIASAGLSDLEEKFQMIKPPLKMNILRMTLTKHHSESVSIARTSIDDDSSAVNIHNAIRTRVKL